MTVFLSKGLHANPILGCGRNFARLTVNNELLGTGAFAEGPMENDDYRRGYVCGIIRGDAHIGGHKDGRGNGVLDQFRLAMWDPRKT